jgi:hypothetical protein
MAERLMIDPLRLALGWGDWHVLAACDPDETDAVSSIVSAQDVAVHDIGHLAPASGVRLRTAQAEGPLMPLDSERFTASSWFSSGLEGYIANLREAPLITSQAS